MTAGSKKDLPETDPRQKGEDERAGGDHRTLNIDHFTYQRTDIDGLAELAKVNPAAAKAYLRGLDRADERANTSYRLGLVVTVVLLVAVLFFLGFVLTLESWLSAIAIVLLLATAFLVRVILTGEWSDTSWFGQFVQTLARSLGSKSSKEENSDDDE